MLAAPIRDNTNNRMLQTYVGTTDSYTSGGFGAQSATKSLKFEAGSGINVQRDVVVDMC